MKLLKRFARNGLILHNEEFYKPGEGAGGYFFRSFNEEQNIFELIPSMDPCSKEVQVLRLFTCRICMNIKPDWDKIFLDQCLS